ncbi:MAG TPA: TraB/GumN family protein [Thermoplasmata archaeon]|nr:TraB/GumN family protein [Thermoplasmata archaeon]
MITLLGVGHVFDLAGSIRREILARRPKVVALELDAARFQVLTARGPTTTPPSLFGLLARFQARIAAQYGVRVGDEMLAAAQSARDLGSEIALIDEDSRNAILRTWRQMSFRERARFVFAILSSAFVRKSRVDAELRRYQEDERAVIEEFAARLPTAKRVLIDERDERMAAALRDLHRTKGDIVAVVGDGHIEGLGRRLAGETLEVVRLRDLRDPAGSAGTSATISYRL